MKKKNYKCKCNLRLHQKSSWCPQALPKDMPFEEIVALKILLKQNESYFAQKENNN